MWIGPDFGNHSVTHSWEYLNHDLNSRYTLGDTKRPNPPLTTALNTVRTITRFCFFSRAAEL